MKRRILMLLIVIIQCGTHAEDPFAPKTPIPEGFRLIEGDILVSVGNEGRGVYDTNFWTNGVIPYEFDSNVSAANRVIARSAMDDWETVANVEFILQTTEVNYVHIQNSTANNSMIGMIGGMQIINISSWDIHFTVCHEFGHTLGLWHEQSRLDRDNYVTIEFARIENGYENNFDKHESAGVYGPYDFDSVMHYSQCAFSCCDLDVDPCCIAPCSCWSNPANCRTITVLPPYAADWQNAIGQREHLSQIDKATMGFLYPYSNWVFVDCEATGVIENGTPEHPYQTLQDAIDAADVEDTLKIQPCTYSETGLFTKTMIWDAPIGGAVIGGS